MKETHERKKFFVLFKILLVLSTSLENNFVCSSSKLMWN